MQWASANARSSTQLPPQATWQPVQWPRRSGIRRYRPNSRRAARSGNRLSGHPPVLLEALPALRLLPPPRRQMRRPVRRPRPPRTKRPSVAQVQRPPAKPRPAPRVMRSSKAADSRTRLKHALQCCAVRMLPAAPRPLSGTPMRSLKGACGRCGKTAPRPGWNNDCGRSGKALHAQRRRLAPAPGGNAPGNTWTLTAARRAARPDDPHAAVSSAGTLRWRRPVPAAASRAHRDRRTPPHRGRSRYTSFGRGPSAGTR